jgi:hypothetical protein
MFRQTIFDSVKIQRQIGAATAVSPRIDIIAQGKPSPEMNIHARDPSENITAGFLMGSKIGCRDLGLPTHYRPT